MKAYLILFFILNLILCSFVSLSYDESYYWIYSKFLSFGYYDHPPMVALLIKLGTYFGDSEFGVRLFFNILSTLSLWLMWDLTNKKRSSFFILISASLPLIQGSGFLALPDTPLLFFSILFLWTTKKYLEKESWKNILMVTISIVLMFYSKYHGLLVVIFTVIAIPSLTKRKSFWGIVFLVVALYLPHMYWQYKHDFITFDFHLNGRDEKHFELKNILNYISSQFVVFGMIYLGLFIKWLKKVDFKNPLERILTFNVLGFLALLLLMSFRNQIEANWTVTASGFFVILMTLLSEKTSFNLKKMMWISIVPIFLLALLRVIFLLPDSFYDGKKIGRLNEIKGWNKRISEIKEKTKGLPVVSETYQFGAKLSFELKEIIPVEHFRGRESHYSLLNLTRGMDRDGEIYYLTPRKQKNGVRIDTGYKDPIYIIKTTLNKLGEKHKKNE